MASLFNTTRNFSLYTVHSTQSQSNHPLLFITLSRSPLHGRLPLLLTPTQKRNPKSSTIDLLEPTRKPSRKTKTIDKEAGLLSQTLYLSLTPSRLKHASSAPKPHKPTALKPRSLSNRCSRWEPRRSPCCDLEYPFWRISPEPRVV